jgi:hypothetical protein
MEEQTSVLRTMVDEIRSVKDRLTAVEEGMKGAQDMKPTTRQQDDTIVDKIRYGLMHVTVYDATKAGAYVCVYVCMYACMGTER